MKPLLICLLSLLAAFPVIAEENQPEAPKRPAKFEGKRGEGPTKKQREQFEKRKYEFMDRELTKLGISDEQKKAVHTLQKKHRELMELNAKKTKEARRNLSSLQDEGATEAQLEEAILQVSAAQTEQLRIFVNNRTEMEKIIGKENHKKLMDIAHKKFKQHRGQRDKGKKGPAKPRDKDSKKRKKGPPAE